MEFGALEPTLKKLKIRSPGNGAGARRATRARGLLLLRGRAARARGSLSPNFFFFFFFFLTTLDPYTNQQKLGLPPKKRSFNVNSLTWSREVRRPQE